MSYSGFLLKIGSWEFPKKYISADSYSAYVNMQDLDAWTDENGYVHREPVDLKAFKVEFETKNMLTDKVFSEIMKNIRNNYVSEQGRTCYVTAYIPEYNDYVTQLAYMPDITPKMYIATDDYIKYNPVRFAFIGGVADD